MFKVYDQGNEEALGIYASLKEAYKEAKRADQGDVFYRITYTGEDGVEWTQTSDGWMRSDGIFFKDGENQNLPRLIWE